MREGETIARWVAPGARVLDLFAGSGAAGIEALSRGAARATFVERDPAAIRVVAANLTRSHLAGAGARVVEGDVRHWLADPSRSTESPFDLVIIDPPYEDVAALESTLEAIGRHVAPGGRVVAKHATLSPPPARIGLLASDRERRFGETTLTFYRRVEA